MDMRVFLVVGILLCVLVCSHAAPIDQQDTRNFIPNRYDIKGTLINDDGTFTRQDPPPQQADEQQQSMYDQFGGGQTSNLAYQPQGDYQTQDDAPYGQQPFQDYQEPESNQVAGQNDQNAYYNTQQNQGYGDNSQSTYTQGEKDDLQGQGQQAFNTQPQQYPANYNDQETPESQFQAGQAYYGEQPSQEGLQQEIQDYQPPSQKSDDLEGNARSAIAKNQIKVPGSSKRYTIPSNLSRKDLLGMLGNSKQKYLTGGH